LTQFHRLRLKLLTGIPRIPVFILLFFNAQLIPGLAAIAADKTGGSQSPRQLVAVAGQSSESICPTQLRTAIDAVINRPQYQRARWGILIERLSPDTINLLQKSLNHPSPSLSLVKGGGKISSFPPLDQGGLRGVYSTFTEGLINPASTVNQDHALYRRDAERYFIPASNVKLITTAAALHKLGSEFRIRTSIYEAGDAGIGSLRVMGRGDPSLTDAQLRELAQQLKRQGIRQVQRLIVDDGYFRGNAVNLSWEWEDVQANYGASVNSLILNQNAVELTLSPQKPGQPLQVSWDDAIAQRQWQVENDSVTVAQSLNPNSVSQAAVQVTAVLGKPILQIRGQLAVDSEPKSFGLAVLDLAEYFLQHFQNALAVEGITVGQASVASRTYVGDERELAGVESPSLAALLMETNQQSNNLYAEVLLRSLGATSALQSQNSDEIGLSVVKQTLTEMGVDPESYALVDGSGLSRKNLVSPEALVQTLKVMAQSPDASTYLASLPVAGISGTLMRRFRDTTAQGNLHAKTSTMSGVSALSGYLDVPGYQPLVFSIIVNQSDQPATTLRQGIDEIVLLLTRLRSC
ncbi:MAG TPA: D-alanyl-D-alanine carboxypeptidase/D-alanyl-D-alanine-endopeptidase, partial [Leptolyngbyaceae cyanobacterium]